MAEYRRVEDKKGNNRYLADGKFVSADGLDERLREALDNAEPGTVIDEAGNPTDPETDTDEGSGSEDPSTSSNPSDTDEEVDEDGTDESGQAKTNTRRGRQPRQGATFDPVATQGTPQSDPGMGFPRKNGFTVDLFDGKTPHTHVRNVNGIMVPLSEENYKTKTDAEILEKLRDMEMI